MGGRLISALTNMSPLTPHAKVFDRNIRTLFWDAFRLVWAEPAQAAFFARALVHQVAAARRRRAWTKRGVAVPPLAIVSVTERCNLSCAGCYAHAKPVAAGAVRAELSSDDLRAFLAEADELGVSLVMFAGGEPFLRDDILELARGFPRMTFVVFTNGLLLDGDRVACLKTLRNVVPVVSFEGDRVLTDGRRGAAVYKRVGEAVARLRAARVFWGTSFTATRANAAAITDEGFLRGWAREGCRLFFFVEYVPVKAGTEEWALTPAQRARVTEISENLTRRMPALGLAFPGNEDQYGGCLAAGRGFIHLSARGAVEPCPFAPFSDTNLVGISLREALGSRLFETIRAEHGRLTETNGGCALWANREWVKSLLEA